MRTRIRRNIRHILTGFVLVLILIAVTIPLFRPTPSATVTLGPQPASPSQVEGAAAFLLYAGFDNPVYLGLTYGDEGELPTFRALAIGGRQVELWIRTTPNGGWEIQPVDMPFTVTSADGFARKAQQLGGEWKQYDPGAHYWQITPEETDNWPRK